MRGVVGSRHGVLVLDGRALVATHLARRAASCDRSGAPRCPCGRSIRRCPAPCPGRAAWNSWCPARSMSTTTPASRRRASSTSATPRAQAWSSSKPPAAARPPGPPARPPWASRRHARAACHARRPRSTLEGPARTGQGQPGLPDLPRPRAGGLHDLRSGRCPPPRWRRAPPRSPRWRPAPLTQDLGGCPSLPSAGLGEQVAARRPPSGASAATRRSTSSPSGAQSKVPGRLVQAAPPTGISSRSPRRHVRGRWPAARRPGRADLSGNGREGSPECTWPPTGSDIAPGAGDRRRVDVRRVELHVFRAVGVPSTRIGVSSTRIGVSQHPDRCLHRDFRWPPNAARHGAVASPTPRPGHRLPQHRSTTTTGEAPGRTSRAACSTRNSVRARGRNTPGSTWDPQAAELRPAQDVLEGLAGGPAVDHEDVSLFVISVSGLLKKPRLPPPRTRSLQPAAAQRGPRCPWPQRLIRLSTRRGPRAKRRVCRTGAGRTITAVHAANRSGKRWIGPRDVGLAEWAAPGLGPSDRVVAQLPPAMGLRIVVLSAERPEVDFDRASVRRPVGDDVVAVALPGRPATAGKAAHPVASDDEGRRGPLGR